ERRFAPAELERFYRNRPVCGEVVNHPTYFLERWLIYVACGRSVGEANGAFQVASVCDVDYRKNGLRFVVGTDSAVIWTPTGCACSRILKAVANSRVTSYPIPLLKIRPVYVLIVAMNRARFAHHDHVILFKDLCRKNVMTFRTYALCRLQKILF